METPILTKKQQKKALSAKKNNRETIKNVLTVPYTHFWPIVNENDSEKIRSCLEKCLPKLAATHKVPWKEIKNIPKEQRKEFRKKFEGESNIDKSFKSYLIFGTNEVTRKLEDNEASLVLLSDKLTPQLMVKHVVNLAVLRKAPILVIPNLKEILKNKTGVTSASFCLTRNIDQENQLKELELLINEIAKSYPVPENHINFNRQDDFQEAKTKKSLFTKDESENDLDEFLCFEDTKGDDGGDVMENDNICESEDEEPEGGWYLQKTSSGKRAFVPEAQSLEEGTGAVKDTADFIGFGSIEEEEPESTNDVEQNNRTSRYFVQTTKRKESNGGVYVPLKVKKIKSDKNRGKRKIEKLKMKARKNKSNNKYVVV